MEMEKITLYDTENDLLVETYVSAEESQRAVADGTFATELFQRVLQQQSTIGSEEHVNVDNENVTNQETHFDSEVPSNIHSETQESEVSLYRWTPHCVLLLLETYRSLEKTLSSGNLSQKKIWERISKELANKGCDVTGPQCYSKLRSLKKTYKSIKDHNSKSGNDRKSWQYFEIMEDIFAKKAWCNPIAVASSSGLSLKQSQSDNTEESDCGCSLKSNKKTIAGLLLKRLKQKEEHEDHKMKRHKERMEMDKKLLTVLEKLTNK